MTDLKHFNTELIDISVIKIDGNNPNQMDEFQAFAVGVWSFNVIIFWIIICWFIATGGNVKEETKW